MNAWKNLSKQGKWLWLGDTNGKVGDESIVKWMERNETDNSLVDVCGERRLFLESTCFYYKITDRYT